MAKNYKSSFGYIRNPFKSFEKKTQLGALKTGCVGCKGCKSEFFGFTAFPCSQCSHNMRNKDNVSAQNYYTSK